MSFSFCRAACAFALAIAGLTTGAGTAGAAEPGLKAPVVAKGFHQPVMPSGGGAFRVAPQPFGNPIERVVSTPTAWWFYYGATGAQISSYVSANSARIVDLQVESVGSDGTPYFTVSMVQNSGPAYGKGWWWYYGETGAQVSALLSQNNARIISISPYQSGSQLLFAVVMVPNTGADAKGWWWYYGSGEGVTNAIAALPSPRVVEVENYTFNGNKGYVAVAISNTGTDAAAWWWYLNIGLGTVISNTSAEKSQLVSFAPDGLNFDSVAQGTNTAEWWYYAGVSPKLLGEYLGDTGSRLTELRSPNGNQTFDALMINNSNALTTQLGNELRAPAKGWIGFKLLDGTTGSVLGGLNTGRLYEPASSIKIYIATYAMKQVELGNVTLQTQVPHFDANNFCKSQKIGTETLQTAITQMMENSDNARADALMSYFGNHNITAFAHQLGLSNTAVIGYVDCPVPLNHTTLDDETQLYYLLIHAKVLTGADVTKLFSMMAGKNYDFSHMYAGITTLVTKYAAQYGLSAAQIASYENGIRLSQKSGGYWWPGGKVVPNGEVAYRSNGNDGYVQLPLCVGTKVENKSYLFGMFYEENQPNEPDGLVFNDMLSGAKLVESQIKAGVANWKHCSP
jgi:hypothetical protein